MRFFSRTTGFEWDEGNSQKNFLKHGVTRSECEEVFFHQPLLLFDDQAHSQIEKRQYALGRTNNYRMLFVCFTIRGTAIRVISARDMNKKERALYAKEQEENSTF